MFKRVVSYICAAAIGIVCALIVSGAFTITEVVGIGMEPVVKDGSRVLIDKTAYSDKEVSVPETGELVAFMSDVYDEESEGKILVRRVVGSPGDTVEIKDDIFYLNDKPYTEYMSEAAHMEDFERTRLGNNEIFVLSDNRKSSMDSRNEAIGILQLGDCIGKVCFH